MALIYAVRAGEGLPCLAPFIGMGARYDFRILPPGRSVRLHIRETEDDEPLQVATFDGDARRLTGRSLALCLARFPFMTFKVTAAIHRQALKL